MARPPQLAAGRPRGVPNSVTTRARNIFADTWYKLTPEIEDWIRRAAEGEAGELVKVIDGVPTVVLDAVGNPVMVRKGADPLGAADLLVRMAEYHVPKLARHEVTGADGGALQVHIVDPGAKAK